MEGWLWKVLKYKHRACIVYAVDRGVEADFVEGIVSDVGYGDEIIVRETGTCANSVRSAVIVVAGVVHFGVIAYAAVGWRGGVHGG